MVINHNVSSLITSNAMNRKNLSVEKSSKRLSTGFRINSAADDSAGLAIANKMKTQVLGSKMADRNTQDAISLIQTAEGGLNEIQSMMQRMRELAVQGANDTLEDADRQKIQAEIDQLIEEIDATSTKVQFNKKLLLDGKPNGVGGPDLTFQVGPNKGMTITLEMVKITPAGLNVDTLQTKRDGFGNGATSQVFEYTDEVMYRVEEGEMTIGVMPLVDDDNNPATPDVPSPLNDGAVNVTVTLGGSPGSESEEYTDIKFKFNTEIELGSGAGLIANNVGTITFTSGTTITVTRKDAVTGDIKSENRNIGPNGTFDMLQDDIITLSHGDKVRFSTAEAGDIKMREGSKFKCPTNALVDLSAVEFKAGTVICLEDTTPPVAPDASNQIVFASVAGTSVNYSVAQMGGYSTRERCEDAISYCDAGISVVSEFRAKLGAYQNRLEHTSAALQVTTENAEISLSRIEDTDMAMEMSDYTKDGVIVQAAISMLAHANQRPQQVLQLLQ